MPAKNYIRCFCPIQIHRQINTIIEEAGINTNIQVMSLFPMSDYG